MKIHTTPQGERFDCQQEDAVDILNRKVEKLDKCIFFGKAAAREFPLMFDIAQRAQKHKAKKAGKAK